MAINLERFVKAKRFDTDFTLDDATDKVKIKASAVSDALSADPTALNALATGISNDSTASATLAGAVVDALAADPAATEGIATGIAGSPEASASITEGVTSTITTDPVAAGSFADGLAASPAAMEALGEGIAGNAAAMTAITAELDATAAEAIAGTVTDKFIAPDDLKAWAAAGDTTGSALVGFKQAGTGAVDRTMQDKAREVVSVKDFGAVGDGVTDQTGVLSLAHATGAKHIEFPYGTYYFPGGLPARAGVTYDFNGSTILGNGSSVGIYCGESGGDCYRSNFHNAVISGYTEALNSLDMYQCNFYGIHTENCAVGWALRVGATGRGSYYNNFYGCHNIDGTVIGLKTYSGSWGGPNTNFFHGCKLYGTSTCVDIGTLTNLCFYGGSIESGTADYLLKMSGSKRVLFSGTRFEGKTGAIMQIDAASQDNGFIFCTISASNAISDSGTRTSWIGGKSSAYDFLFGYTLSPNDQYAKIGDLNSPSTMWSQINGKKLNLYGDYSAINLKTNFADANNSFSCTTTGFMQWGSGSAAPDCSIYRQTPNVFRTTGRWEPATDNTLSSASASQRWSVVFSATGTINTSDAREKKQIRDVLESERAVAVQLKSMIRAFKWNDAVEQKGDDARIHFGVIAQEVKAAFEAEGLNAMKYGVLCYDEWDDEFEPVMAIREIKGADGDVVTEEYDTGEKRLVRSAGNRYGVRHDQLFALIISAL